jgi:hypothetical protein
MSEAASAAEFVIERKDPEIAPASAIVECAKKRLVGRSWLLFASLLIKCIGRCHRIRSRVLMLLREVFVEIVGHRSPIAKSAGRTLV